MEQIVIFLRGVNVNGINIKMEELVKVVESMGYSNVKTVLASGNVIATSESVDFTIDKHKLILEQGLANHFHYDANIIMKTPQQILDMIEESLEHVVPSGYHHYVLLTTEPTIMEQLESEFNNCLKAEREQLIRGQQDTYWIVPKGETLGSEFGKKVLGKKAYKSVLTTRTINTIKKIALKL